MSRARLFIVTFLLLCSAGGALATTALASPQWRIGGSSFSGTETVELNGASGYVLSSTLPGGEKVLVSCGKETGTGVITENVKDTVSPSLKLSECKITEPAGCKLSSTTLTSAPLKSTLEDEEEARAYDKIEPETGTTFYTVTITECAAEGKYKVTGSTRCEIQEPTIESTTKTCDFTNTTGSALKFGTEKATLENTITTTLTGPNTGKTWNVSNLAI